MRKISIQGIYPTQKRENELLLEERIELLRQKMYLHYQETNDPHEVIAISQELDKLMNTFNHSTPPQ